MDLTVLTTVRPGDKMEMHFVNRLNEDVMLETLVYDIESETEILIHNPVKDGKLYMIPMDVEVTAFAKRDNIGVIMFRMLLIKRRKMGNVYTIECQVVSDLQKQQRRHFFRVKVYQDITLQFMVDRFMNPVDYYIFDPDLVEEELVEMKAAVIDISGGGIGVKSKVPLPIGTYVYSPLSFLNLNDIIYGRVVRCIESKQFMGEYELGIAFEDIPNEIRKLLTSYVFTRQQKIRRKEITDDED